MVRYCNVFGVLSSYLYAKQPIPFQETAIVECGIFLSVTCNVTEYVTVYFVHKLHSKNLELCSMTVADLILENWKSATSETVPRQAKFAFQTADDNYITALILKPI